MGDEDHVCRALKAVGSLHIWRLAIKPGRPIAMGTVGNAAFVGLPGNPAAMIVTFIQLARPLILRLSGAKNLNPHLFVVCSNFDHYKKPNRREWIRVRLVPGQNGTPIAHKFERQGSGILISIVASDGLVELPEALTHIERGTKVQYLPFSEVI